MGWLCSGVKFDSNFASFASIKIISSKRRGKSSNLKSNLSLASEGLPKMQAKRGIFMICFAEIV